MNQYIITGDEITLLFEQLLTELELEAICKVIHSRPYNPQADREKVLDGLCKSCQYGEEMPDESCFDCVVGVKRIELRKGEQG